MEPNLAEMILEESTNEVHPLLGGSSRGPKGGNKIYFLYQVGVTYSNFECTTSSIILYVVISSSFTNQRLRQTSCFFDIHCQITVMPSEDVLLVVNLH